MTSFLSNVDKLARLNAFRAAEGKAPFADWRAARHQPMLDTYLAAQAAAFIEDEKRTAEAAHVVTAEDHVELDNETNKDIDAPKAKAPSYKDFANYDRSRIMKPVEYVHSFLDAHPDLSRKAAVQALVEAGVNYSTARTQYQRWFTARKG